MLTGASSATAEDLGRNQRLEEGEASAANDGERSDEVEDGVEEVPRMLERRPGVEVLVLAPVPCHTQLFLVEEMWEPLGHAKRFSHFWLQRFVR